MAKRWRNLPFNNVYLFTESPDFRSNLLLCLPPGQDAVKLALSILKVDGHPITEDSEDQPKSGTRSTSGFNAWISSPSIDFHRARPLKVKQSKRIGSRSSPKRIWITGVVCSCRLNNIRYSVSIFYFFKQADQPVNKLHCLTFCLHRCTVVYIDQHLGAAPLTLVENTRKCWKKMFFDFH